MKITGHSIGIMFAAAVAIFGMSACSSTDKTYSDPGSPAAATSTSTAKPADKKEVEVPSDSKFFDHVITNKCDPGKEEDGFLGRVHVVATIKNILDDSDATYMLNYKVFDSRGMQVAAVIIDATAFNGPVPYGDSVQVDDHFESTTGKIPADGRFTCKLFKVDRMTVG